MSNRKQNYPLWLASKVRLHSQSWWVTSKDDNLLCAFPKSGGTWVRFFLYNLLNRLDGFESAGSFEEMDTYMPEYGHPSIAEPWRYRSSTRIIKNHNKANPLTRGHNVILLVRDPRNVAVSYYWYANAHRGFENLASLTEAARDPRYGLEAAISHYASWQNEAGVLLQYESLIDNPVAEFQRLCDFLKLDVDENLVSEILSLSSKDSMRDAQRKSPKMSDDFDGNYEFARKSSAKEWQDLSSDADKSLWQELCKRYDYEIYS